MIMHYDQSLFLTSLLVLLSVPQSYGFLDFFKTERSTSESIYRRSDFNNFDTNPNGSTFVWLPQDEYSGKSFFDTFDFFTGKDPTNGKVDYVNSSYAFSNGLAYVQDDGIAVMKGDNTSWLADGEFRKSVRISSHKQYNGGLFILDVNRAPWGCAVWPAFWTVGGGDWPYTGEVDIIEGVHDNMHNQVAFHTAPGCVLNPNATMSGTVLQISGQNNTECNGLINFNSGCGITEWSQASYGPLFDQQGGGVFAMKWDENGISIWSFFRAAVPPDIGAQAPNPSLWGKPSATLEPETCDPFNYFKNHSMIFDITFCGDWAGNSYATSGCPGTCDDRLKDPGNFVNATWSVNHIRVYRKQLLVGIVSGATSELGQLKSWFKPILLAIAVGTLIVHGL